MATTYQMGLGNLHFTADPDGSGPRVTLTEADLGHFVTVLAAVSNRRGRLVLGR